MKEKLKEKIIKPRTIEIIAYLVVGLLCGTMVYATITAHKNSLKIDGLKEIKNDIRIMKERMSIIGEKAGKTPSELSVGNGVGPREVPDIVQTNVNSAL